MFSNSTQCKYWMFSSEEELKKLRENANSKHIQTYGINEPSMYDFFLTPNEEKIMVKRYEVRLRDFCKRFQPPMPRSVIGTAFHYFKRFYINNSVMNHHPKEIMVTCIYLACKVEEFNVSIQQFVANLKGDREKAADIILNNELLLMEQLRFHLSIHNPFRPVEGLLIDIKKLIKLANPKGVIKSENGKVILTPKELDQKIEFQTATRTSLNDPERLRQGTESFLEKCLLTDVILLYSPSQVALASVLYAASKLQENLDSYVTDILFGAENSNKLDELIEAVRSIRLMVKMVETPPDKSQQKNLDKKLEKCRNPENNPDSEFYKRKMQQMMDDDDELYHQISSHKESVENSTLNMSVNVPPEGK